MDKGKHVLNNLFVGKEPWQISAITASSILFICWFWNFMHQPESVYDRIKRRAFCLIKKVPYVAARINQVRGEVAELFEKEIETRNKGLKYVVTLPKEKGDPANIIQNVETHLNSSKYKWKEGFVSGTVYHYDEALVNMTTKVYGLASYSNPLHPDVFPGICKMESEIIQIVAKLFHGDDNTCGTMTSGGTESIIMACKAYRDYGKAERGINNAEIVLPRTAHSAFDKAANYFQMKIRHIEVDKDMTVILRDMEKAINKNTVMLVGSAPNFPHGTMDDIEAISKLGQKYKIPVHVDCCLGSFVIAFMPSLGYELPPFDFTLQGVTSISVDTHKYGFAPKGSSVILYSNSKYRQYQYYVSLSWPGGQYASPSVSGSRAGGIIAACWATLMYFGQSGYMDAVQKIVQTSKYIENELRKIDGIFIFGKPMSTVIAIGSDKFHIYRLFDALNEKTWNLNMLQFPFGIHICVTYLHTFEGVADRFISDVKIEVEKIMKTPNVQLEKKAALYGMSTTIPDRTIIGDIAKIYLDSIYHIPKNDS